MELLGQRQQTDQMEPRGPSLPVVPQQQRCHHRLWQKPGKSILLPGSPPVGEHERGCFR